MIVPMKKISLVMLDKCREESLEKLRGIGVVHLEKKSISSDALTKLLDRKQKVENALRILGPCKKAIKPKNAALNYARPVFSAGGPDPSFSADRPDPVIRVLDCAEQRKYLQGRLSQHFKEQSRIEEWGDFNPKDFSFLAEKGKLNLFLYKLPCKYFESLPEDVRYIKLGEDKKFLRLLVFDQALPEREPFALSEYSFTEINSLISSIRGELAENERTLALLAEEEARIEAEAKALKREIEFETARAGMNMLEDVPQESTVAWLSGFVPAEDLGRLKRGVVENGWALIADDPEPEDRVPTKLKNNRLVSLLNPLTGFLDVLPGYREVDISGWFLLFFTIFFGMIFGDAAYGALFIIIAIAGIFRNRKKAIPAGFKLLLLLGSSNFIWGVLTCSWFGLEPAQVPLALQQISLPQISNVTAAMSDYHDGIVRQNLMVLCFSLALLQLSIGHIIAIAQKKTIQLLGDIGSIAMLIGMYGAVLAFIASNEHRQIPFFMPCLYALAGGFALNFVFANYEGSIGKSILESLKSFIAVILNIANVFSDIMSYLRLWAVGLAGAAIASIVNNMAGPVLGSFLFFLGIILLVFGHGLNLVLNALSVLVHGVRLNTLEFSGRIGLNWTGFAYKPFED